VFLAAAVGPFVLVWALMATLSAFNRPVPLTNFSNIAGFVAPAAEPPAGAESPTTGVIAGRPLWKPAGPEGLNGLGQVSFVGDRVALADGSTLCVLVLGRESSAQCVRFAELKDGFGLVRALSAGVTPSELWALGFGGVLVGIDLDAPSGPSVTASLKVPERTMEFFWETPTQLLVAGSFGERLLVRYDVRKSDDGAWSLGEIGAGSPPLFAGLSPGIATELNETVATVRPRGDLIAEAFVLRDRLRVFNSKDLTLSRAIAPPVETLSSFAIATRNGAPALAPTRDTASTYLDLTATDDAIIALYSGHYWRTRSFGLGRTLHVYSWDGRLRSVVSLGADVSTIDVHHDSSRLIAVAWDTDTKQPRLEAYDLRDIIRP